MKLLNLKTQNLKAQSLKAMTLCLALAGLWTMQAQELRGGARPNQTLAADAHSLIGTWKVTVTPDGIPPFTSYTVFGLDGNSYEFDNSNPPAAQTIAVGPWTSTGVNRYAFTQINQLFDDKGGYAGELKVRATIEMTGIGDTFKSTFTFDVFDPTGTVVFSGTGKAVAKRVVVEGQ